jgi:signal transduction histidine kinase
MNVEDLPVAVVVLDADRVIVSVNEAAGALVLAEPKALIGKDVFEALRPRTTAGRNLLHNRWHSSAALQSTRRLAEQDLVLLRSDGNEIEVTVDGAYDRDDARRLTGATLMIRQRMRGPRRPRSGVRIVSAVSHELRSPLTSVRGYTSLLLKRWDEIEDGERKVMLQQVDRDARRISRMITELLDIARLESGRLQLNRVSADLVELLDSVLTTVEMSYPDIDVTLDRIGQFDSVWADPDKVQQVLTNLLENACKYASPRGIQVHFRDLGGETEVAVSDRGPGIPEADLPLLFQQFFKSTEGRPSGTGLGLWISRGLIEAHGGTMTAESREGVGTTFRFTLPQRRTVRS